MKGMSHKMQMGYGKKSKGGYKPTGALKGSKSTKYSGAMAKKGKK